MDTSDPRSAVWYHTAIPAPETPPLTGDRKADVVVVGGGFTGLSAALHMAEAGLDTVLLEAEAPGFGATGRNNGQVVPAYSRANPDDIVARFGKERGEAFNDWTQENPRLLFELVRKHGIDCDAQNQGWLMPAHSPKRLAVVRAKHDQWAARGAPVEFLDAAKTAELTGSDHYLGAWYHKDGGNIQPLSLARGLAAAALKAGAAIHAASPARSVTRADGAWKVATPAGSVTADKVVIATNAYTDDLWPGLKRTIVPITLWQAATKPLSDNVAKTILPGRQGISDARRILWAFRKDAHGRLLTDAAPNFPFISRPQMRAIAGNHLLRAFPQIGEVQFDYLWNGKIAVTLDRLPRFHELAEGVYAGLAYSGRGIAMGIGMGKLLAARVQGTPASDLPVPLASFNPLPMHGLSIPIAWSRIRWDRLRDNLGI